MKSTAEPKRFGEIDPHHLYRATEACHCLGWSSTAYRSARRKGLAVKYWANRAYLTGKAILDFMAEHGKDVK